MHLRNGDWVVVCDGGKFVVYENQGDADRMDLRTVSFGEDENPPTHDQGTDRPGRYSSPDGQRSAVGQTDWHDQEEKRFVESLAARMDKWSAGAPARRFVLVADPRSMGVMRAVLEDQTKGRIEHMITGDHVRRPVADIEKLITAA
ncbi:MAG: host attachment protein [Hyphomonas sp.]|nr:host attachment protein [Hyphomonas sp.]